MTNTHSLKPLLHVGKNGLTESVIQELKKISKTHKTFKIKLLKSFAEGRRKEIAQEIAKKTDLVVDKQIGYVLILRKDM